MTRSAAAGSLHARSKNVRKVRDACDPARTAPDCTSVSTIRAEASSAASELQEASESARSQAARTVAREIDSEDSRARTRSRNASELAHSRHCAAATAIECV